MTVRPDDASAASEVAAATGDLSPELFVRYGRQLVEWVADYLASAEQYPVLSRAKPASVRSAQIRSTS